MRAQGLGNSDEGWSTGTRELYLGDAIHFFLSAKRAGSRSEKTVDDYRKKLELFQRWLALRLGSEYSVDAPYINIGPDEVEAYVVHLKDGRGMADSSRKPISLSCAASSRRSPGDSSSPTLRARSTRCASIRGRPSGATSPSARPRSCSRRSRDK